MTEPDLPIPDTNRKRGRIVEVATSFVLKQVYLSYRVFIDVPNPNQIFHIVCFDHLERTFCCKISGLIWTSSWWRHQMVTSEFPARFHVFYDLHLNKRLSKQWWGWWFEKASRSLWRHCDDSNVLVSGRRQFHCVIWCCFSEKSNVTDHMSSKYYRCCTFILIVGDNDTYILVLTLNVWGPNYSGST